MKQQVHQKDNGKYLKPLNYSGTLGRVDNTALQLINACKTIFKDDGGEYVYDAESFDNEGNVFFKKRYLSK